MNYKKLLEDRMPVTFDSVGIEDGQEVERMWLADFVDGKWVEDYLEVSRTSYDTETDEYGAVFALIDNGKMLVKAPNIEKYRIPESVYRIADNAFSDCDNLKEIDVPYNVSEYEIGKPMKHCNHKIEAHIWYWCYDQTRSEELEKEIAEGWTDEYGFVYSKDRKRLLKAANVDKYWIPEGVEKIDRLAFVGCIFEELNIPYTCNLENLSVEECPIFGNEKIQGCILDWDRPYSQEETIEESSYLSSDVEFIDEDGVAYSNNGKRLLWVTKEFDKSEYHVKDGIKTICSDSFVNAKQFLTLSVPSSIEVIGNNIFGKEGGRIVIRKD